MASLKLKEFHSSFIYIISGYLRQIHSQIDDKQKLFQTIPSLITLTTLQFYVAEYFSIPGQYTMIMGDGNTIKKISNNIDNTTFGNLVIPSTSQIMCRWTIKVGEFTDYGFAFGISSDYSTNHKFCDNINSSNYAFCALSYTMSKGETVSNYGTEWHINDEIGIQLNLKERNIEFLVNGQNQGIAYHNIEIGEDIAYRLATYVYQNNVTVKLINFEVL